MKCALLSLALGLGLLAASAFGQAADRAVFVANNGNLEGSVTAFAVNEDGTVTFVNRIITGTRPNTQVPCPGCNPYEISLTPGGKYLATCHATGPAVDEQVTFFRVWSDASIEQIAEFLVPGTPMDLVWITDDILAVHLGDSAPHRVATYLFNPITPSLTQIDIEDIGNFSGYLAVHPSGQFLYANNSSGNFIKAFAVDSAGALTLVDTELLGSNYPLELTLTHDGMRLYAAGGITHVITGFDVQADGSLIFMPNSPFPEFGSSPSNLAVSGDDAFLVVGHGSDGTVRTATIDPATGDLAYTGNLFDVGIQGSIGDVKTLGDLIFVTDNFDGTGLYSFTLNADGSFTMNGGLVSTQGIAPRSIAAWAPVRVPGDMNCDGALDFADINPFVLALTNPEAWELAYPGCDLLNGDIDGNGAVGFGDINPFVALFQP